MVGGLVVGWDCCAESKSWDLLIAVVVLEDVADGLDGPQVLVLCVHVVEGLTLARMPIRKREVHGDGETDLATPKDVLKERVALLDLKSREGQLVLRRGLALLVGDEKFALTTLQLRQV